VENFAGSAVMKVAKPESQAMMSQTGSLSMTRVAGAKHMGKYRESSYVGKWSAQEIVEKVMPG